MVKELPEQGGHEPTCPRRRATQRQLHLEGYPPGEDRVPQNNELETDIRLQLPQCS